MINILLADDHDCVRRGVKDLLEDNKEWHVCGEAADGNAAVRMAARMKPNIAVLDLYMPNLNGLEATRQIRKESPDTEVLIFTVHETEQLIQDVLEAGARGYVLKSESADDLISAIQALCRHKTFFTTRASNMLLEGYLRNGKKPDNHSTEACVLTAREREIVQLLGEGKSNRKIGTALSISVNTVESHRATIMRKLGLHSIADIVRYAVRNGVIEA